MRPDPPPAIHHEGITKHHEGPCPTQPYQPRLEGSHGYGVYSSVMDEQDGDGLAGLDNGRSPLLQSTVSPTSVRSFLTRATSVCSVRRSSYAVPARQGHFGEWTRALHV